MQQFRTIEMYRGFVIAVEQYTLLEHAQQAEKQWCQQHRIFTDEDREQLQEEGTSFTIHTIDSSPQQSYCVKRMQDTLVTTNS